MKIEYLIQPTKAKMNKSPFAHDTFPKPLLRGLKSLFALACLLLAALAFCASSASAASLIWDAGSLNPTTLLGTNTTGTVIPASGYWDVSTTTNSVWDNGAGDIFWSQASTTSPTFGTTFTGPNAAAGTYQVNADQTQVAATNISILANGYVLSGQPIYLTGNGSHFNFFVADGKNVTISNNLTGSGSIEFALGSNGAPSSATFYGPLNNFTPYFTSTNGGSVFYLAGGGGSPIGAINADVRLTNGTYNSPSAFVIARNTSPSFPNANSGSFTADGPATIVNQSSDYIYLGRQGTAWNATFTIQNGATVNYQPGNNNNNLGLGLPRPGSSGANCVSRMFMYGGTLNMGPGTESPQQARPIFLANGGSLAGEYSGLTQTGGVINAWGGIQIGGTGTYSGGSAMLTNSGGFLYIGSIGNNGIKYGANVPPTNNISLSGGTVGALQNWISSCPMTLSTLNGNITFQCADANTSPWNISLSGAITGLGGLNMTGGGQLTLSGVNSYAGSTVVSNGFFELVTTTVSSTNGPLTLDGSAGTPTVAVKVSNQGQNWQVGTFTTANNGTGTPTLDFQHGTIIPSTTVAALQVAGNVNFAVTPYVSVTNDTALPVGKFPLIQYTGTVSGTPPTVAVLPASGYCSGYVSNSVAAKTLFLVITQSTFVPAITWAVGSGTWDFTSANWTGGAKYVDGDGVAFNDSASGTGNLLIALNTTVNPSAVTFNNSARENYTFAGTGGIAGSAAVTVQGNTGSDTLATTNTYTGGTTVFGPGQLNINYGGTGNADSAIGAGPLNLNTGAKLDNTSGRAVVLNTATPIPINMNDDWTFVGSTNLDLGLGPVTLGNVNVVVTVVSNTLSVNNPITDNGNNFKLTKAGGGALTISNLNSSFGGGVELDAGTLNINSDGSAGSGAFTILGGNLDNTSGGNVTLTSPSSVNMYDNFTFNGSGYLDISPQGGSGQINIGGSPQTITLNGTNALETDGAFLGGNRNTVVNGTGSWIIGGIGNNGGLGLTVNGGTVFFAKASGTAEGNAFQINTNAAVVMVGATGGQIGASTPVTMQGGTLDMAGDTEPIGPVTFNSGTLMNSAPTTASGLPVALVTLDGPSCVFNVSNFDSSLTISNVVGSGGLVLTGLGTLDLTTNDYSGATTISNGTLVVSFPTFATNSTITLCTNAALGTNGVLTLNFPNADTNTVAALVMGGVSKAPGMYNATTDPFYISGNGNLLVVPLSTINPLPGPLHFSLSGSTLALSWPTNLGWILQSQTNGLGTGLVTASNAWFDLAGSAAVTTTNLVVNPTNPSVFFRLRHP
jgi:autotransporter-associated beta strand protein